MKLENIYKKYKTGSVVVTALNGINLEVEQGDFIAVTGKSGCGKTTLLNILGGLDKPSKGNMLFNGKNLAKMNDLSRFRRESIGFVFQFFNLIPILTVEENICLPMLINGKKVSKKELDDVLEQLGLTEKRHTLPSRLSGGQQQRVAIGRAIISKPSILLADEPTGNLDSKNADIIIGLLEDLNQTTGQTIIIVTHDSAIANRCPKNIQLSDGTIVKVAQ